MDYRKSSNIYRGSNILIKMLCVLLAAITCFSAVQSVENLVISYRTENYLRQIQDYEKMKNDYGLVSLKRINKDIIGWITCEDIGLTTPLVKAETKAYENYYLDHDLEGNRNALGTPYVKVGCELNQTTNSTLIGHSLFEQYNEDDGYTQRAIFGNLYYYLKPRNYYNYKITIETFEGDFEYEVFAAFKFNSNGDTSKANYLYSKTDVDSEFEFSLYYDSIMELSVLDNGVTASYGDKIITLYTCSEANLNYRVMVFAKLVE